MTFDDSYDDEDLDKKLQYAAKRIRELRMDRLYQEPGRPEPPIRKRRLNKKIPFSSRKDDLLAIATGEEYARRFKAMRGKEPHWVPVDAGKGRTWVIWKMKEGPFDE